MNCFSGLQIFFCWWIFVSSGSPFRSPDLTFIDQLGGTIYWCHDRHSIFNQHIKGLNPSFTYHHRDITLIIVTKQTSKENTEKSWPTKIWLWNLDKCSRLMKSCLHAYFLSWVVVFVFNIVDLPKILILNFMHRF